MFKFLAKVIIVVLAVFLIPKFRGLGQDAVAAIGYKQEQTPLYLPKKEAVRLCTLGYENFVSQLLWFSTINYFGEKFLAKESMPWFNHRCDLVTDLDPQAKHVYEFCGTLLSWIAKEPQHSNLILTKAIAADPSYWRFYYLRGFNYWYFLEDFEHAKKDFEIASTLPNAPTFLVSLAGRLMVKDGDEDTAISFLKSAYVRASDLNAKQAIAEKLNLAVVARDVRQLTQGVESFRMKNGKLPDGLDVLKKQGIIEFLPQDPFGEDYLYDNSSGKIQSRKGGVGLAFKGKTFQSTELGK